jgi:methyl-accepting chemotaxis protein
MPEQDGAGALRQQIGETRSTVNFIAEQIRELKSDTRQSLTDIKGEQAQRQSHLANQLDLLSSQVRDLSDKTRTAVSEVTHVKEDSIDTRKKVEELEKPVRRLDDFRKSMIRWGLVATSALAVVWSIIANVVASSISMMLHSWWHG